MTISPGEEFKLKATPSPELQRKLAYLAAQDNDSVLTGGVRSPRTAYSATADKAAKTADMVMMARLADPAYQAMSARINDNLDRMDEASVRALQEIEEELAELRREREQMLEQAYRDEQGRAILMTKDGTAAYYEDGTKVADDEFARHKEALRGKPAWEQFKAFDKREQDLSKERDQIHAHDAEREKLREDLAAGRISKEEAERRERELEKSQPDRARRHHEAGVGQEADNKAAVDTTLNADEMAELNVRDDPAQETATYTPPPGAAPPQP